MMGDRKYCAGCRDDFYNGNNDLGVKECWSLKNAKVVTRFKVGYWTPCDRASNFVKIRTHNCHTAPGRYALYDELPRHLQHEADQVHDETLPPATGSA